MPLLRIQTNLNDVRPVDSLLKLLSSEIAALLNKPENYVMTSFHTAIPMTFGGSNEPTCYIEVKSVGSLNESKTKIISNVLCNIIEKELGVASNRTFISFEDYQGTFWGWNGQTFG